MKCNDWERGNSQESRYSILWVNEVQPLITKPCSEAVLLLIAAVNNLIFYQIEIF